MADGDISPWLPEQDRIRLAVLGKLIEELNEMSARAARCIIHGLDETDPDTGRLNRDELAREAADVKACLHVLGITEEVEADLHRTMTKVDGFGRWHKLIRKTVADWQIAAFDRTLALAESRGMDGLGGPLDMKHLRDMRGRITEDMSRGKLGRWLGWAQAAVVASGCATLDDMKEINRLCSEAAA